MSARAPAVPIAAEFQARVRLFEPMAAHTSWRVGGPADVFFLPRDVEDLAAFLRALAPDTPVYWVGLGTNLLVRDRGIRGVVISPSFLRGLDRLAQTRLYCEAGLPCARIARACERWGLAQAEFLGGIPGTLGGALAMNAGAFGDETWRHVLAVTTIDREGRCQRRGAEEYRVGYRQVEGPKGQEWFLSAELRFEPLASGAAASGARALAEQRRITQPLGLPSCGSVFRNPPGDHAARLIEASGLKGCRIGGAVVSEKHANFIINDTQAQASDIEALIRHVQQTVEHVLGVHLEPEVRIVGESAESSEAALAASAGAPSAPEHR